MFCVICALYDIFIGIVYLYAYGTAIVSHIYQWKMLMVMKYTPEHV